MVCARAIPVNKGWLVSFNSTWEYRKWDALTYDGIRLSPKRKKHDEDA
jgi:hypothetical protein